MPSQTRRATFTALIALLVVVRTPSAVDLLPIYGAAIPQFNAGTQPQSAGTADFNCDGVMDAVVARATFQSASTFPLIVYTGNGAGGFVDGTSQVFTGTVPRVQWPREMVVDDFNGDGRADVFIADTGRDVSPWPGYQNVLALPLSTTMGTPPTCSS